MYIMCVCSLLNENYGMQNYVSTPKGRQLIVSFYLCSKLYYSDHNIKHINRTKGVVSLYMNCRSLTITRPLPSLAYTITYNYTAKCPANIACVLQTDFSCYTVQRRERVQISDNSFFFIFTTSGKLDCIYSFELKTWEKGKKGYVDINFPLY